MTRNVRCLLHKFAGNNNGMRSTNDLKASNKAQESAIF